MTGLIELLPPIHLYAILVASMTLMVKALEFCNTDTNRFILWLPVWLVVLAWGHTIGYMVHQLLILWRPNRLHHRISFT